MRIKNKARTPRHVRTAAHFGNYRAAARPLFGTYYAPTEERLAAEDRFDRNLLASLHFATCMQNGESCRDTRSCW